MGAMASLITSLTSVYWTVHPGADQRKHQSSASLAFVWEIHRRPVNSPHKWPVTRKMFPFDDVIMIFPKGKFNFWGMKNNTNQSTSAKSHEPTLSKHQVWGSKAPGRCDSNFESVITKHILEIKFMRASCEIALSWMSQNNFDNMSTLIQVMACWLTAQIHLMKFQQGYLSHQ